MNTMKATHYTYCLLFTFFTVLLLGLVPQKVSAQIVDPLREYTNPDEVVAFNKSTTYNEAIEIIDTFAQEYENKFIVDNSGYSGAIGVNLPAMHWKDALQYIMRFQNLELNEFEEYYEIVVPQQKTTTTTTQQAGGATRTGQGGGDIILPTTETREVRINATFFEGNKRALQEIGVDWSTLTSDAPEELNDYVAGEGNESLPNTEFTDQFVAINSFNAQNVSQNAFNAIFNTGDLGTGISVQALFSAFEADNLGKVLATPSIKVVDGEEGNIQVGQDFSIKQRDIAGNVTDNFVSTGTILTVTPQIITQEDTSFIYLNLEVERSTAQPDVVSTIINKQEATTSAILLNGESTYVAGLYRTEETTVRRGIPLLKDVPLLKYIFGFNSKDYLENELIIIVQAELVEPVRTRFDNIRKSKRDVLNNTRDDMRADLDRVFSMEEDRFLRPDQMSDEGTLTEEVGEDESAETPVEDTVKEEESAEDETLTEEQKEVYEELSMPVQKPELMVVVPKAFSLEEYLEYKANGGREEIIENNLNSDIKYFIIGGSFLVPGNAQRFKELLDEQGYNTRILFNPETRFNYVAYEGYADFEKAVDRTYEVRGSFNSEAWLFTLQDNTEEVTR
ncbi:type II secretion system protein GspD [Gracilimonas amylolytica]|uniref:type II secretion system protein GspD n=1 Tax=Gracilimonas amylolytica TaxID=1749045 RepID=UPI000CD9B533|nr:type II and III secretion system protein [Gracilimonas amylolytica]